MENKDVNLEVLAQVAMGLGDLINQVVFVGGAVVSLYADSEFSDLVRPTYDIDIAVDLLTYSDQVAFQELFTKRGFHPDIHSSTLVRYHFNNIQVDLMSTMSSVLGESNSWYKPGFDNRMNVVLEDLAFPILPVDYFLATKFEAFNNRGKNYYTSKDFEDIVHILNYNESLVDTIRSSELLVQKFLVEEIRKVKSDFSYPLNIEAHLDYLDKANRLSFIQDRINQLTQL